MYVPVLGHAAAESDAVFPHEPKCLHCSKMLLPKEARWHSGLCDGCYGTCIKECTVCESKLALRQLHWNSGLCDPCYDAQRGKQTQQMDDGLSAGVRTAIGAQ